MLSASSTPPQSPPIAHAPNPIVLTMRPVLPSRRYSTPVLLSLPRGKDRARAPWRGTVAGGSAGDAAAQEPGSCPKPERPGPGPTSGQSGATDRRARAHHLRMRRWNGSVSYTHLRAHETVLELVCRL